MAHVCKTAFSNSAPVKAVLLLPLATRAAFCGGCATPGTVHGFHRPPVVSSSLSSPFKNPHMTCRPDPWVIPTLTQRYALHFWHRLWLGQGHCVAGSQYLGTNGTRSSDPHCGSGSFTRQWFNRFGTSLPWKIHCGQRHPALSARMLWHMTGL